jgi:hypothetical protein
MNFPSGVSWMFEVRIEVGIEVGREVGIKGVETTSIIGDKLLVA